MRTCYINRIVTSIAEKTLCGAVSYAGQRVFLVEPYRNKRKKAEQCCSPRGKAFKRMFRLEINRLKREAAYENASF